MRALALFFMAMTSAVSQAQIEVQLKPTSPVVIDANLVDQGRSILAPWFRVSVLIFNRGQHPIVPITYSFEVASADKSTQQTFNFSVSNPIEIAPGQATELPNAILDALPRQANGSFIYNVTLTILGWTGTVQTPTERWSAGTSFQTQ